ncbi:DUF4304 domain-containing protein [Nocardioides cavernae]|uniref:DUF4304 domain-containing protein n=1 Tax=Nocardioides cavernae TaxID=1921566 RepID=A0ABR8NHY4_9ACTN|nr:DUF4304 domain-containing protein [Nocardioides cavernae]MBD3926519.1 DUF4304 domain-containing protein [Nocardioides cavernae]MBM7512238.1 hypothetical protein [Nocardioides cavernae]
MTIQAAFRDAVREVLAPAARAHGFKGSGRTWRRTNELGDCAIVNLQGSSYSSASSARYVINLSVVPEPWAASMETTLGRRPKALPESWGLYRRRLQPTGAPAGTDQWWRVDRPRAVEQVVADMVRRLDADGWPTLEKLLDREAMVEQARTGDLGFFTREHAPGYVATGLAVLLSDSGTSDELDGQLDLMLATSTAPALEGTRQLVTWIRTRAASRDAST